MSVTSKLTKRHQTTLPAEVRKRLQARPGDTLEYDITDEGVLLRVQQPDLAKVLPTYLGVFKGGNYENEEDAVAQSRKERGWDEVDAKLFENRDDE